MKLRVYRIAVAVGLVTVASADTAQAQMRDTLEKISGNAVNEGIHKNIGGQIGAGRGNNLTPELIHLHHPARSVPRDPARAADLPAQVPADAGLQRPRHDGSGNIARRRVASAPVSSIRCAGCHGRPRGSAGHGGDVFTRPDSRDAPHLFGLGLQEMLGDEITADLRGDPRAALAAGAVRRDARRRAR